MIVRCPSCQTRRELPSAAPGSGAALVACSHCGHDWIENLASPNEQASAGPQAGAVAIKGHDARLLLEAARRAQRDFGQGRRARRLRLAAWGGVVMLALSPLSAALAFPEQVVATFPASIRLYEQVGREVNLYGLALHGIDVQHLVIDGRKVIVVKGSITNSSAVARRVPMLRLALRGADKGEVDHWILEAKAKTLEPGANTSFMTRLSPSPEAARNLEIRFARADEIGSNAAHE